MDFQIEPSAKIKARIYGESVELSHPTVGMVEAFEEQRASMNNDKDKMVLMKGFLVQLGMPHDLINRMEVHHYTDLIEKILTPKKK